MRVCMNTLWDHEPYNDEHGAHPKWTQAFGKVAVPLKMMFQRSCQGPPANGIVFWVSWHWIVLILEGLGSYHTFSLTFHLGKSQFAADRATTKPSLANQPNQPAEPFVGLKGH